MSRAPGAYPRRLRFLHWTTAGLVLLQFALALTNILVYESRPVLAEAVVQAHLSLGATVFALTALRLYWRQTCPLPPLPNDMNPIWQGAARTIHVSFYLILLSLPVTGYLKLAALGFEISLFGMLPLPALPLDIALSSATRRLHTALAAGLGLLILGHAAAALLHRQVFGSPVLQRMWPMSAPGSRAAVHLPRHEANE